MASTTSEAQLKENLKREYVPNLEKVSAPFCILAAKAYKFWGLFEASFHARRRRGLCSCSAPTGSASRAEGRAQPFIYGARISLTIGLLGVGVSLVGIVADGMAHGRLAGGLFDVLSQRGRSGPSSRCPPFRSGSPWRRCADHGRRSCSASCDPRTARLDRACSNGALEAAGAARGGTTSAQVMGASSHCIVFRHLSRASPRT